VRGASGPRDLDPLAAAANRQTSAIGRFTDESADFPESHLAQAAPQLACGHTRDVEAAMDDGSWARLWSLAAFVWTILFTIVFPIVVLVALYTLNKALEELGRKHDQTAAQVNKLVDLVRQSLPSPEPAPALSFEQPPVAALVEGSALQRVLADPETRKVALSMRRVYGWSVAVSVVKRKAVELGLGELEVTEDELSAALQSELPALPPTT